MSADDARQLTVSELLKQADEAIVSARSEAAAGRLRFAMNRVYYACFYAASAVLMAGGRHFVKHTGVRAALHQHLVRTGRLPAEMGTFYDSAFQDRLRADYGSFSDVPDSYVFSAIERARLFVQLMGSLVADASKGD